jgi:hypothetical protein
MCGDLVADLVKGEALLFPRAHRVGSSPVGKDSRDPAIASSRAPVVGDLAVV